ncbi:unnamed protein product, partial [Mesorhabditis belari]|uniref:RING-type domain-containing protein n=1 Tax=Mesorhabditis belari TaxID=2138241 RepID=A0AAF3FDL4_9BILA
MEYVEQFRTNIRTGQDQLNQNLLIMKTVGLQVIETVLRLPGLILLELWWRNRDMTFEDVTQEMLIKAPFNSYMDITTILDFVHRRNLDQSAGYVLSYSVLLLAVMLLTLPLSKLFRTYCHFFSLVIFAIAQYMSTIYVRLEQKSQEVEIHLDDFVKLERHGFHFLAQLMLAVLNSFVLGLESDLARLFLTPFTIPIIARMCSCPLDKLIVAHNVACSFTMFSICIYILNKTPSMAQYVKNAVLQLKAVFFVHGLAMGAVTIWRRLRIAELLTCTWLTIFHARVYVELWEKGREWKEAGRVLLTSIAEATNTPLSLLALALTVSFVCKWVVDGAQLVIGGTRDHGHVLANSGCTEGLILVLLCVQAGVLGMKTEQKAFLLGLVFFVVLSALLHSLFDLVEPQLLVMAASPTVSRGRHIRCLFVTGFLFVAPITMSLAITSFLPLDLWCVIIVSNCILITIHSASTLFIYFIGMIEAKADEPWESSDDLIYNCRLTTKIVELLIALAVLAYGLYTTAMGNWTVTSVAVLIFHVLINIYKRIEALVSSIRSRNAALHNFSLLQRATPEQLEKMKGDMCAICFTEMVTEARVAPCKHLFHGACLRKWLAVKQVLKNI